MQRATYSPVHSDSDSEEDNNDATPVRRFRLNTRDGHARPLPSPSHSPSPSGGGQDDLDRAMREFYATGTRVAPGNANVHTPTSGATAHIASPLPQRHGSISSSEHSAEHSTHSRPSSSQHTFVDETTPAPWENSQPPQFPQLSQQSPHQQSQIQYPNLAHQQPQHAHTLPPIPTSSPLYQQNTFSTFARPISAFSNASGPQIVPVQPWTDSRTSSAFAPNSAYGHPFANAHLALGQNVQPTGQRNSYLSHSHHSHTGTDVDGDGTEYSEEEVEEELGVEQFHGQRPLHYNHQNHSQFVNQYTGGEKPFGGWAASKSTPNFNGTPRDGDVFATPQPDTLHYGPAPVGAQVRRRMTKKKIPLTQGHLVLDLPVPSKLVLAFKGLPEMTKTRYTAVTCDPDEFLAERYSLRQIEYGRQTELFIVITMYNENEILFCRTLHGVMKNIAHLTARKQSKVWGVESWKKVVVCIVADGRRTVHPRVLDCLTALGVYQGDYMKNMVNGKAVQGHMFEYTCGFGIDPEMHFKYPDKGIVPTQIIFLMKENNQKKINSHRWFFNAFGQVLQPNICVLLDVGTRPAPKSLYAMWKAFDRNSNVGGACGEIAAYKGPFWRHLLNPLVAAQNYEYKMSNILDKPNESMFGYISVLPGAFSAYRYIALQDNKITGRGPLASYFKGEVLHGPGRDTDIFTSNMYLAEDRILSFELVAKVNSDWILKYVKGAVGETDVPDRLDELIMQRRRWLNGSFFAAVYALAHVGQIMRSGHGLARKVWLGVETVYNAINLVFAWFAIGNYCLFFVILTSSIEDPVFKLPLDTLRFINLAAHYVLATIVMACFLFSMGNRPKASPWKYNTTTAILALLTGYMVACGVLCAWQAVRQVSTSVLHRNMVFSLIITYGAWLLSAVLALDPWHLVTCMLQYTLLSPLYLVVLNIYAFANLDDITWGTKGTDREVPSDLGNVVQDSNSRIDLEIVPEAPNDLYVEALENLRTRKPLPRTPGGLSEGEKDQIRRDYYANLRTNLLLAWALSNGLLVVLILSGVSAEDTFGNTAAGAKTRAYMTFVLAFVAITNIVRFVGSTLFTVMVAITG